MRNLMLGILLGSTLTTLGVGAADLYDRHGQVQAPRGSQQQYDYFRQRQFFLDVQKQREQGAANNPCPR
jgi:hypothetical protein